MPSTGTTSPVRTTTTSPARTWSTGTRSIRSPDPQLGDLRGALDQRRQLTPGARRGDVLQRLAAREHQADDDAGKLLAERERPDHRHQRDRVDPHVTIDDHRSDHLERELGSQHHTPPRTTRHSPQRARPRGTTRRRPESTAQPPMRGSAHGAQATSPRRDRPIPDARAREPFLLPPTAPVQRSYPTISERVSTRIRAPPTCRRRTPQPLWRRFWRHHRHERRRAGDVLSHRPVDHVLTPNAGAALLTAWTLVFILLARARTARSDV